VADPIASPSSPSPDQSTPVATSAPPVAASPQAVITPQTSTPTPPARPEIVPEKYWDASKGEINHQAWRADTDRLLAFEATEISRKASVPPPDKYELKFADDFKLPEGVEWQWKADDPLLTQARQFANANGLSQGEFSRLLGLHAASQVGEQQMIKAAHAAELGKLGATANTRVDAVKQFVTAMVGDQLGAAVTKTLFTAAQIQAFEIIMQKFSSQGGGNYSGAHREVNQPDRLSPEAYGKLTYSEKKEYAAKFGNGVAPA
jgi:hypothetical protein